MSERGPSSQTETAGDENAGDPAFSRGRGLSSGAVLTASSPPRLSAAADRQCDVTLSPDELAVAAVRPVDESRLPIVDPRGYQVLGAVAAGGIGRILRARDERLGRTVALKELRRDAQQPAKDRFVREALLTARLQHPSIVPLYEAGRWPDGEPFYAMKLVAGRSLADVIDGAKRFDQRLALVTHVLAVAEAVAYAHSERIIHRDLKPANVLIGDFGETVVIDWGLAKDLADTTEGPADPRFFIAPAEHENERGNASLGEALTVRGAILGTPVYMPIEQATGDKVDERADVYAIGAILYHVLAGVSPYQDEGAVAVLQKVIAGPPPPLESREKNVPDELLAIVRKAMARDAADRYPTAKELADDLRRFQTGQIVAAHRYSPLERLRRFGRRHRALVAASATAAAMLAALGAKGIFSNIEQRQRAEEREAAAEESKRHALQRAENLTLVEARAAAERDPNEAIAWLKTLSPSFSRWSEARLIAADASARGIARVLRGHTGAVNDIEFSPDGRSLVSTSEDATVRIWDTRDGVGRVLTGHYDETWTTAFTSGRLFVTGSKDKTLALWDLSGNRVRELRGAATGTTELAVSAGLVVSGSDGGAVYIWDWTTGQVLGVLSRNVPPRAIALSPDGLTVAMGTRTGIVQLRDLSTDQERLLSEAYGDAIRRVAFSPDGRLLAAKTGDGTVHVWDLERGTSQLIVDSPLSTSTTVTGSLRFSPDGAWLASAGEDPAVRLWSTSTWALRTLAGHESRVIPLAFSPDSRLLATGSNDRTARVWDIQRGEARVVPGFHDGVTDVAFSPDGARLAVASADHTVRLLQVASSGSQILGSVGAPLTSVDVSPDGRHVVAAGADGVVRLWNLATRMQTRLEGHKGVVADVVFSRDGTHVISTSSDGTTRVWNLSGKLVCAYDDLEAGAPGRRLALSPDGTLIATSGRSGTIHVHALDTGEGRTLQGHVDAVTSLGFSPDSKLLASASLDRTMRLWHLADGTSRTFRSEHPVLVAAFSPDGRSLLSGGEDHALHVRDLASDSERVAKTGGRGPQQIAFTSPGDVVVTADSVASRLNVWSLPAVEHVSVLRGHSADLTRFVISPDGTRVASASMDRTVRLWDLKTGASRVLRGHTERVEDVAFAPDGRLMASVSADGTVRLWADDLPHDGPSLRVWLDAMTPDTIKVFQQPTDAPQE